VLKIILQNFHLEKIFWIIKKNLKYMILVGFITGVLTGVITLITRTNLYAAQISLYVYSNPDYINDSGVNLSSSDLTQASSLLNSYMQILKSKSFLNSVIEEADLDPVYYTPSLLSENIKASAVSGTAVFKVTVYDHNPYNAMNIANTIGKLAPDKIVSIVKSGGIEVLDEATLPTMPYESTSVSLMAIIGVFAGAFLAALFFLVKGLRDTRYRRVYEVVDMFNIPILGMVPSVSDMDENGNVEILLNQKSPFVLKEAYNDIRTSLLYLGRGEKCPVFVITSADYEEGKTTSSINVATSFACMDKKTLLIDADLRNGDIGRELKLSNENGLSDYLAGISKLTVNRNVIEKLDVITTGTYPPNPMDLLFSENWKNLIQKKKEEYDVIIIDTPAIGVVSDGIEMADISTAYVLVIREMLTRFEREELIVRRLEAVDANICGFIYNAISVQSEDYNHKEYANGGDYGKRNSTGVQHRKIFKKMSSKSGKSDAEKNRT